MKLIKLITFVAFLGSFSSIICGFILDVAYSEKLIGFGDVGIFLIVIQ